ncbi:MAG: (d)CMP kinase [Lachnospiraceae bacterium]|nr:(d)CMP kinase [Lachnospiraceae bacterium]
MIRAIAIDGPAGAGKSTIAKRLAAIKNFVYVDTGAMYRAIALYCIENDIPPVDDECMSRALEKINVTIDYLDGEQIVFLNGENVNGKIRTQQVGNMASSVSVIGKVRERMVALQQELARTRSVIMDGRDIGTVVLPDALVKIYLTASVEIRAKRRYDEYVEKGVECDLETLKKEIADRDHRDMTRDISPLRQAEDAVVVDSSYMTIDEVVAEILKIADEKGL